MKRKVVLNRSGGEFGVSREGFLYLMKKCNWKVESLPESDEDFDHIDCDIFAFDGEYDFVEPNLESMSLRSHPDLVSMVETLKERANAEGAYLEIIEIPREITPVILKSDGLEYICDYSSMWPKLDDLDV